MSSTKPKGHFPRKGEKLVNGEWVMPTPQKPAETPQDRVDYLRRQAGWPALKRSK